MKISKKAQREAKQLFRCCFVDGLLDENRALAAVRQTAALKPRGYAPILAHLLRLLRLELQRRKATVESAVALPEDLQAGIQASLLRLYGAGLKTAYSQNPALIGGLRVQVGSDVYDGSVQSRLEALRDSF